MSDVDKPEILIIASEDEISGMYVIQTPHGQELRIAWSEGRGNEMGWLDEDYIHGTERPGRMATPQEEAEIARLLGHDS